MYNTSPTATHTGILAFDSQLFGDACTTYQAAAQTEMGNVNIYDIYVDVCTGDTPVVHPITTHSTGTDDDPSSDTSAGGRIGYDPCIGNAVTQYLNRKDVQAAIHANMTLSYPWSDCSPRLDYSYQDLLSSMLPIYKQLFQADILILAYSGD